MHRCSKPSIASIFIAASAFLTGAGAIFPSEAQAQRLFPQRIERGEITFTAPPQVLLNGQPERLSHGVRVRTERNTFALSGTLRGKTFVVNYVRDPAGMIREIWLLTPEEAQREVKPLPNRPKHGPADAAPYLN